MLSDVPWLTVVVPIVLLALAVLTFVLRLMGDPKPLSPANVRKPFRFVKRKYVERQEKMARRRAQLAEQTLRNEQGAVLEAFEASVLRLLDMEQSGKSYHRTEWYRQIDACKRDTLRFLRQVGIRMNGGQVQHGPWIEHVKTCSIIMDWGPCKWNIGRVRLVVLWHPNPELKHSEFYDSYSPRGTIEHVKVLSKPLTDADMDVAGWTYFEEWHSDYGYGDSEWIPVDMWREGNL